MADSDSTGPRPKPSMRIAPLLVGKAVAPSTDLGQIVDRTAGQDYGRARSVTIWKSASSGHERTIPAPVLCGMPPRATQRQ
jgi:hypothetical protein